ncbi:hypothetical protein BGZ63DRAFT_339174, partial [Mariannaea sp. PMI_226]
ETEPLQKEALDLRREVLGEKHPNTIMSMANPAAIYHEQARYGEAESLQKKALHLQRETLGEHPDAISSMANLVLTYRQYDKTEGIYQELLDLRQEVLGEKYPNTISSMVDLA